MPNTAIVTMVISTEEMCVSNTGKRGGKEAKIVNE